MSVVAAKRVVSLYRSIAGYESMVRKGLLTVEECAKLVHDVHEQVRVIRSQLEIDFGGAGGEPPVEAPKGPEARSAKGSKA